MTASGIVTVTVKVAAPKIEITNVEFRAIDSEAGRSMYEEVAEITR
mgnify:FL=1